MSAIKNFKAMSGPARRAAMRDYLSKQCGLTFGMDPHAITWAQRQELSELAKLVNWRKSITSSLSLGSAFYVYLSRGVAA